jgi:hypothetical protein
MHSIRTIFVSLSLLTLAGILGTEERIQAQTGGGGGSFSGRPSREQIEALRHGAATQQSQSETAAAAGQAGDFVGKWQWIMNGKVRGERWTNNLTINSVSNKLCAILFYPTSDGKMHTNTIQDLIWQGRSLSFTTAQWVNPQVPADLESGNGQRVGAAGFSAGLMTNTYSGQLREGRLVGQIMGRAGNGATLGLPWMAVKVVAP